MEQGESSLCAYASGCKYFPAFCPYRWYSRKKSLPSATQTVAIRRHQYTFDRQIGFGRFGAVYAARHLPDGKPVAIKVVSLATIQDAQAKGIGVSLLNELKMARRLNKASKHIARMYDFHVDRQSGLSFLVMELGQQDLEKYLLKRSALTSVERKAIWRQLVDIAITLYERQIVHLDIKPDNLVIFPGDIVKLVDLGIAHKAYEVRRGPNGSAPYSAPEVTGIPKYQMTMNSTKADMWSWGAVLYRMTYMTPPDYNPPCYRPPVNQFQANDPYLLNVLQYTLVIDPADRPKAPWLVQHPYTITPK